MKKILTILFALALILCLAACGNDTPVETEDAPRETTVEATRPEGTLPDATIPDATIPDVTLPDVTLPDVTIPDVTIPDVTIPDVTLPEVTLPEEIDPPHTHSYADTVTRDATCTADGQRTYTCECGDSYTQPIPKLGHSYTDKVTAPTCTDKGYTTHTCTRCADSYRDNEKAAIGHSTTSKVTTAATCEKTGVKTITCSRCSYKTTENSYAAATCVKAKTCTACGATSGKAQGHSYTYKTTKTPTTSATGTLTGTCSRCTSKPTVTLPKLTTTDYTRTQTKAPTCTASGTDTWKWKTTTYGNISFTTSIAAKGHQNFGKVSVAESMEVHCTDCGGTAYAQLGGVRVVCVNNYWKNGELIVEALIMNATSTTKTNIYIKELTMIANGEQIASDSFSLTTSNTLQPYSHMKIRFVFSGNAIKKMNADLSNLEWYSRVEHN